MEAGSKIAFLVKPSKNVFNSREFTPDLREHEIIFNISG